MSTCFEWREAPAAQFAVIGDPVGHSMSPRMHNTWLRSVGREPSYIAVRVPESEFDLAMERICGLGLAGVNVTVPLKELAFKWVDTLDQAAAEIGAVNCIDIASRHGRNTDSPGFLATLATLKLPDRPRTLLIGAGGSAAAVAHAVCSARFDLAIWNRTSERAAALADRFGAKVNVGQPITVDEYDLVVNATSGIEDIELPIAWESAKPSAVAYDLMYGRETPFLGYARSLGLIVKDGTDMLVEQGALSMEGWLGQSVDRRILSAALEGRP